MTETVSTKDKHNLGRQKKSIISRITTHEWRRVSGGCSAGRFRASCPTRASGKMAHRWFATDGSLAKFPETEALK